MPYRLSNIYKVTTLTADRKVEEVLSCIMHDVKYNLGFDQAGFFLLDEKKEFLDIKSSIGFDHDQEARARSKALNIKEQDCFHTKVVKTGKEMVIEDTENDPRATKIDKKINKIYGRRSALYFPLKIGNEVIGVLGISSKKQGSSLKQRDLELIRIFVAQASIAFENARLYERLLNEKRFTESVLQSSVNGILTVNNNGLILFANSAAEKILGMRSQDCIGNSIMSIFPELANRLSDISQKLSKGEQLKHLEFNYIRDKEESKILNVNATQLITEEKENIGTLITLEDLTEKKRRDEYLSRMDKMASLGYLAAGVAHEVRNPLTSISLELDGLFEKFFAYPEKRKILQNVLGEIDRLDRIVSQLLEFARIPSPQFSHFDINLIVKDTCGLVQKECRKHEIKMRRKFQKGSLQIYGAEEKMKQALLNVILNAIQAMPKDGGTILIKTRVLDFKKTNPKEYFKPVNNKIEIIIKDNGIGINQHNLSKIFYPFFTTKPEGTGLGLSIANSIIEEHNGVVMVNSEEGKGTVIRIQLPMAQ